MLPRKTHARAAAAAAPRRPQALLSPGALATCRQIDEVRVPDFPSSVGLVAFDLEPSLVAALPGGKPLTRSRHGAKAGAFQRQPSVFNDILFDDDDVWCFEHPDVLRVHNVDSAFLHAFRFGFKARLATSSRAEALR